MTVPGIGGGYRNPYFSFPTATGSTPAATDVSKLSDTASIMNKYFLREGNGNKILGDLVREDSRIADFGLRYTTVSFQDACRSLGSVWGPRNLHDVRYALAETSQVLPIVRTSNLRDLVFSIPSENFKVKVQDRGCLKEVSLKHYLQNFKKYNPEWKGKSSIYVPDIDDNVIVSLQAAMIPLSSKDAKTEFGISAYSYYGDAMLLLQSAEGALTLHAPSACGESSMLSTSNNGKKHFLEASTVTRFAKERKISREEVLERGINSTLTFQIPIIKPRPKPTYHPMEFFSAYRGGGCDELAFRGDFGDNVFRGGGGRSHMEEAAITLGRERGEFETGSLSDLQRNPVPLRVDMSYYMTCEINSSEMGTEAFYNLMKEAHKKLLQPILDTYEQAGRLTGSLSSDPELRARLGFTKEDDKLTIPEIVLNRWHYSPEPSAAAELSKTPSSPPRRIGRPSPPLIVEKPKATTVVTMPKTTTVVTHPKAALPAQAPTPTVTGFSEVVPKGAETSGSFAEML